MAASADNRELEGKLHERDRLVGVVGDLLEERPW